MWKPFKLENIPERCVVRSLYFLSRNVGGRGFLLSPNWQQLPGEDGEEGEQLVLVGRRSVANRLMAPNSVISVNMLGDMTKGV